MVPSTLTPTLTLPLTLSLALTLTNPNPHPNQAEMMALQLYTDPPYGSSPYLSQDLNSAVQV